MSENGNTPAMPQMTCDPWGNYHYKGGLSKREIIATMIMQGLLSNNGGPIQANPMSGTGWCNSNAEDTASLAVECADVLLAKLEILNGDTLNEYR